MSLPLRRERWESKAKALRRTPLFAALKRSELERIARVAEDIDIAPGKVLAREGESAQQFFLITDGRASVTKSGRFVRELGPGDFFGEIGLIERGPFSATVRTLTEVRCFVMSSQGFWGLLSNSKDVELRVLHALIRENVAEREIAEQALREQAELNEYQALHDALTGLPNRTLFRDRVERAVRAVEREGGLLAVLMLDLDRFKEVNDTLGHQAGDALLAEVGRRLESVVRAADTVARLGGDEFGIVLSGADRRSALEIAGRIGAAIEEPIVLRDLPLGVEASVGIGLYPEHGRTVDDLIQCADLAMYVAKEEHARYAVYEPSSAARDPGRLTLVGDLRQALEERELVLYYQPKAQLSSGAVRSVEALVRWAHPERGLIPPDEFIPLTEQTGLIKPLTLYVLDEALRQCAAWKAEGLELSVAVNLATRNLLDTDLPRDIAKLLLKWGVESRLLELEITESTMLADPARTKAVLHQLSQMGIRFAIDDFGTGYSSLAYLKSLPVTELKIDRSFVMRMATNEEDAAIVRSTIDLARNLGLDVVAEGVETQETWDVLRTLRCDSAQGYFLSKPVPAEELVAWVRDWQTVSLTSAA
jgi:diguanylate cyclase (GGDEF)-like protein